MIRNTEIMLLSKKNKQIHVSDVAEEIISIFKEYGNQKYRERCNLLSHSIQTGLIAKKKGYDNDLILSGFLHDIGRLIPLKYDSKRLAIIGNFESECYHKWGEAYLRKKGFSERVIAPIANHIKSKRYLCYTEKGYYEQLSPISKHKLVLQGGAMSEEEAKIFKQQSYFEESILIRRLEEKAKVKSFIILKHHFDLIKGLIDSQPQSFTI